MGPDEKLHGHGVDLADIGGRAAAVQEGLPPGEIGVEAVAALVGKGLDRARGPVKGLEDKGHSVDGQVVGVSAPDLARPVLQIVEPASAQVPIEYPALRREAVKDAVKQLRDLALLQPGAVPGEAHVLIKGPEHVVPKLPALLLKEG